MSSFNLLSIGTQALLSNQSALSTIGQNISNVNTDGYSRQRVDLVSQPDQGGVYVRDIERIADQFLTQQLWTDLSAYNQTSTFADLSDQLDNTLASSTTSVSAALDDYFGAMQNVVDDPVSVPNRELFVAQADALVKRFNDVDANIQRQNETVNGLVDSLAGQVTALATNIADLNDRIRISAAANNSANELRDQRDTLTNKLSEIIGIKVMDQSSDEYSIYIGNGQPLVVGQTAHEVVSVQGNPDRTQNELGLVIAGHTVNINDEVSGGKLGGLLQYREEALNVARDELGRIAIGFAESMNVQHRAGIDLKNDLGGDLFKDVNTLASQYNRIAANANNQSTVASARVEIEDIAKLQASDYELVYGDKNQITLVRNSDGKQIRIDQLTEATADRTVPAPTATLWQGNGLDITGENLEYDLNSAGMTGTTLVSSALEAAVFINKDVPGVSGVTATTVATISGLTEAGISSGGTTTFDLNVVDDSGNPQTLNVTLALVDGTTSTGSVVQSAIQAAIAVNGGSFSNLSMTNIGPDVTITDSTGGNIGLTLTESGDTASFTVLDSSGASVATALLTHGGTATSVATGYISDGVADNLVADLKLNGPTLFGGASAILIDDTNNVASTVGDTKLGIADVGQGEFYLDPAGKVLSFAVDGIKVTIETKTDLAVGDRFLLQPVRSGADDLSLVIQDGRQLALASPIRVTADTSNQGTGVATVRVTDSSAASFSTPNALTPPLDIVFNNSDPLTYTIYDISVPDNPQVLDLGAGPLANQTYTAASEIQVDGYAITIDNLPGAGDRFRFAFNQDGVSDNRNALSISNLQQKDLLDGGSYQDLYGSLVERVGTRTATSRITAEANKSVLDSTVSAKASISGVNLDEEAAKLVQFQQAYQASAQLISVSQTLFDSLLNSL